MVKIMETPIKMDDLGGTIIFGNTHVSCARIFTWTLPGQFHTSFGHALAGTQGTQKNPANQRLC